MVSDFTVTFAAPPPLRLNEVDEEADDDKACFENDISGDDDDRGDDNSLKLVKEPDTKRRFIEKFVVAVVREKNSLLFGIERNGVSSCTNVTPVRTCEYDSFHLGVVLVGIFSKKSFDSISSISCRQLLISESMSA